MLKVTMDQWVLLSKRKRIRKLHRGEYYLIGVCIMICVMFKFIDFIKNECLNSCFYTLDYVTKIENKNNLWNVQ